MGDPQDEAEQGKGCHAPAHQTAQGDKPPQKVMRIQSRLQHILQADQRAAHPDRGEQDARQAPPAPGVERELPPPGRDCHQAERVDPAGGGGGERDAHMGEPGIETERDRQHEIGDHHGEGDLDRRQRILPRQETGDDDLDQHEGGQAEGVGRERRRHLGHLMRPEVPALEQHMQDRVAFQQQGDSGRQRQEQGEFQPAVLGMQRGAVLAPADMAGEGGENGRRDRHTDDAQRQLVQPVGIGEVGDGADRCQRGDGRGNGQVDLRGPRTEHAGQHDAHQPANLGRNPDMRPAQPQAGPAAGPGEPEALGNTGRRHGPGELLAGDGMAHQRDDQEQVEQD